MLRGVLLQGPEQNDSGKACAHISALLHRHLFRNFIFFPLYICYLFHWNSRTLKTGFYMYKYIIYVNVILSVPIMTDTAIALPIL